MAALSEEQQMIKDQAVAWVKEQAPLTTFRAMRDQGTELGFFPETWSAMTELGWSGMLVPEAYGGAGLGYQPLGWCWSSWAEIWSLLLYLPRLC